MKDKIIFDENNEVFSLDQFLNEDVDGYGYCKLSNKERRCSQFCEGLECECKNKGQIITKERKKMKILKIIRMLSWLVLLGMTAYILYQHVGWECGITAASFMLLIATWIIEFEYKEGEGDD